MMHEMDGKGGNHGLIRIIALACLCLAGLVLFRHGFAPRTRAMTFLAVGILFSMAAVYELAMRDFSERVMAGAIAAVMIICALSFGLMRFLDPAKPQEQGPLIAARLPTPANGCGGKPELTDGPHLLMIFGRDGVIGRGDGPFTPVRIGNCPAPRLTRVRGGLMVDGFGYDADNNVVYRIRRNIFEMMLRGYLTEDRSDKSVLRIVDENSRAWLTISYLNTNTVRIAGTFGCGGTKNVTIGDDAVRIGGVLHPGGACKVVEGGSSDAIVYQDRP